MGSIVGILLISLMTTVLFAEQDNNDLINREQIVLATYHYYYNRHSGQRKLRIQDGSATRRDSLETLAEELAYKGQYNLADSLYQEVLNLYKQCGITNTEEYVDLLYSISTLYLNMGNYAQADYYEEEARKNGGTVFSLTEAISDYLNSSPLDREDIIVQHVDSLRGLLGNNHSAWADLSREMGDEEEAKRIENEAYIRNYTNYAEGLISLAEYYIQQRKYHSAEPLILEADSICHQYAPQDSALFVQVLKASGKLYMECNDFEKSETCLKEAYSICLKKGIQTNYHFDNIDATIGDLYLQMGDYEKAEHFLMKSQDELKLAHLYEFLGNIEQATQYYEDYLSNSTDYRPSYLLALEYVGMFYYRQKRIVEANRLLEQALSLRKDEFFHSLNFLSEFQRGRFWNSYNTIYSRYYTPCLYIISSADKAYNLQLFTKGLLLASNTNVSNSILDSNDSILQKEYNDVVILKNSIDKQESQGANDNEIKNLRLRAEHMEKDIIRRSAAYRESLYESQITWDSVRSSLTHNQVAIECMVVPINNDSIMYCALILRDTCSHPVMIPLFEENEILSLIKTSDKKQINNTYGINGKGMDLTQKVWSKIFPYIKKEETIYFAPSGLLHQLAIETLPYDSKNTIADVYNIVRVSSTREIVKHKNDIQYTTATLYGGIQYTMDTTAILTQSERYDINHLLASHFTDTDTLDRGNIGLLPWTKQEVEEVASILKENYLRVRQYTSEEANEESFKALSGQHQNIIHIATHGFFWSDSTAYTKDFFSQWNLSIEQENPPTIDPLNRCGLLFAGAQTAWSGHTADLPNNVQDGILTAKEISLLDLRDANLVVLSACETGKGDVTSEGVFGLQRAFKQAGVQTIIMSLWPVNDTATKILMTEFYKNWIERHQSKRESLRNAQTFVRRYRDKHNQLIYKDPYYWAGFIMLD